MKELSDMTLDELVTYAEQQQDLFDNHPDNDVRHVADFNYRAARDEWLIRTLESAHEE